CPDRDQGVDEARDDSRIQSGLGRANRDFMARRFLAALAILCAAASAAFAQTPYGSVRGTVRDEHLAVLPGATITATAPEVAGVYGATSDSDGTYRLVELPPRRYTPSAGLPDFAKVTRDPASKPARLHAINNIYF